MAGVVSSGNERLQQAASVIISGSVSSNLSSSGLSLEGQRAWDWFGSNGLGDHAGSRPVPFGAQEAFLRKLASALNRSHRRAKMQHKQRLQQGFWRNSRKVKATKPPPTSPSSFRSGFFMPPAEKLLLQTSHYLLSANNITGMSAKSLERSNEEENQSLKVVALQQTIEKDKKEGAIPLLSTSCQASSLSFERSRIVNLLPQQNWLGTRLCDLPREEKQPIFQSTGDRMTAVKKLVSLVNANNKLAIREDRSFSSVCTYDKEQGINPPVASLSLESKRGFEKIVGLEQDAQILTSYGKRETTTELVFQRIESLPPKCDYSIFSPKSTVPLNFQTIVACDDPNVQAESVASKPVAPTRSAEHPRDSSLENGVDICDSGSSTSGGKILFVEPLAEQNSNTDQVGALKVEATENSINAGENVKVLPSQNDPDEVQQLSLLDILADAAVDAGLQEQGKAVQRMAMLSKGILVHGQLEYIKKRANRRARSILTRFQALYPENFVVDSEFVGGLWAPLQVENDFDMKPVDYIDQIESDLHEASQPAECGVAADRSKLRRTAGLPIRLHDSVVEFQSRRQSKASAKF